MKVKPVYQRTELGVIPEDWAIKAIGDLCSYRNGKALERYFNNRDGYRVISIGNYSPFGGFVETQTYISKSYSKELREYLMQKNDLAILLNDKTSAGTIIGRAILIDRDDAYIFNQRTMRLRCKEVVCPAFLYFQINSDTTHHRIVGLAKPGTQIYVNTGDITQLRIPLPATASEQKSIAEALNDGDTLIKSLEQLITKKRDLKHGAMQELLSPKDSWIFKKLEDIADVIDPHPSHRAPPAVSNGIPFVGIGDLDENGELVGNKIRKVDPSVFDEHLLRYDLNEELIGLGRVASIGKVVKLNYAGTKYAVSPTLGIIRGTRVRRDYLLHALKSKVVTDQFKRIMSGSTRSSVGMVVLRKLDIALPVEEEEQTAIASTLSDMDAEIAAQEAKLAKARQLKQGMMQELLTGRTRLV